MINQHPELTELLTSLMDVNPPPPSFDDKIRFWFKIFCTEGKLAAVELFSQLKSIDSSTLNEGLASSCMENRLDIVKFLLAKPECDIDSCDGLPLYLACQMGHLDIVRHLTTESDLNKHADIYASKAFVEACANKKEDVVDFFLYDLNMQLTNQVSEWLSGGFKLKDKKLIINRFNKRDLFLKLNDDTAQKEDWMRVKI